MIIRRRIAGSLGLAAVLVFAGIAGAQDDAVVRITDGPAHQTAWEYSGSYDHTGEIVYDSYGCDSCGCDGCGGHETLRSRMSGLLRKWADHDAACKRRLCGYFAWDGCCGQGCPPKGCYHMVYAAHPHYLDPRDGQIYAAQGYGIPIAVPLAPNVRYTYNYGWGVPSSRLTPISLPPTGP